MDIFDNIEQYIFIETSAFLKEVCKRYDLYCLPSAYAKLIYGNDINIVDNYNFEKKMGMDDEIYVKCIYGFGNMESFKTIIDDAYKNIVDLTNSYYRDWLNYKGVLNEMSAALISNAVYAIEESIRYSEINEVPSSVYTILLHFQNIIHLNKGKFSFDSDEYNHLDYLLDDVEEIKPFKLLLSENGVYERISIQ